MTRQAPASLLAMAAPLVVSFWMRAAVTFVDTVFAALLGDAAVAAIGLTIPLEFLMIAIWVGASTGLTSRLSRSMGALQHAQVEQYLRIGRRIVAVVTPVFGLAGVAVWWVAPHMGLADDVAHDFRIYGTVLIVGSALTTFWSIIPDSLVKAHQDTRSTMWAGIWSNIINVGLNALFMFVFGWGLFGIALSTVLGRIGGLAYAIVQARRHERRRRSEGRTDPGALDPAPLRSILELAVPSSLTFALMATETALINWILARQPNATEGIAAYSIYYRFVLFGLQPVIAVSVALLPYAARRFGAGDYGGVRQGLRWAMAITAGYAVLVMGPLLLFGAPWLAHSLAESPETARYATFALRLVPLACLASGPFLLCRPVFEAMQQGRPGLFIAIFRYLVLTGPLAWLGIVAARATALPEVYGVIAGSVVASAIASAVFYLWLAPALPRGDPASG